MNAPQHDQHPEGPTYAHVVSVRILALVFVALVLLTLLTVGAAYVNLGPLNIWVALGIAVVKGSLVVLVFMHLFWDKKFHALVLISALLFVMIFIGIAMLDSSQYQSNLIPGYAPAIHP